MYYQVEFDIHNFKFWSGALDTIKDIENADLLSELEQLIIDTFEHSQATDTAINDFVWHDSAYIYETLGLNEDGELDDDF